MEDPATVLLPTRDELLAELTATRAERDALADALWSAEDQWRALIDARTGTAP